MRCFTRKPPHVSVAAIPSLARSPCRLAPPARICTCGHTPFRSLPPPVDLPRTPFIQDHTRFAHIVQKKGRSHVACGSPKGDPRSRPAPPCRGGKGTWSGVRAGPWRHSRLGISDRRRTSACRGAQRGRLADRGQRRGDVAPRVDIPLSCRRAFVFVFGQGQDAGFLPFFVSAPVGRQAGKAARLETFPTASPFPLTFRPLSRPQERKAEARGQSTPPRRKNSPAGSARATAGQRAP